MIAERRLDVCEYKAKLAMHRKSHEVYKFLCQFKARQSSNLKKHVNMVHGKIRYKCVICVYTAATKYFIDFHSMKVEFFTVTYAISKTQFCQI